MDRFMSGEEIDRVEALLRAIKPCRVHPPMNGALGSCADTLANGDSCTFACKAGLVRSGQTTCRAGVLSAAVCEPTGLTWSPGTVLVHVVLAASVLLLTGRICGNRICTSVCRVLARIATALVMLLTAACISGNLRRTFASSPAKGIGSQAVVTFLTSKYRMAYNRRHCPDADAPDEVVKAVRIIVKEWARRHDLADGAAKAFLEQLFSEWALQEKIADMAQKVWTSAKMLDGREFCFMLNELVRDDAMLTDDVADQVATLARTINSNVVARGMGGIPWPDGPNAGFGHISTLKNTCFRGGGFCDKAATRDFFVVGRKYRIAGFLATSFHKYVAERFLQRVRSRQFRSVICYARTITSDVNLLGQVRFGDLVNSCVLWIIELDPMRRCNHVNLVTATHVSREFEFLFSAYSAFEVVRVNWSPTPQDKAQPHEITLRAAPDNKDALFPEDLPLAPWN